MIIIQFIATVVGTAMLWFTIIAFASMPFVWIWIIYHKIKCWRVEKCPNRKCTFWKFCYHTMGDRLREHWEEELRRIRQEEALKGENPAEEAAEPENKPQEPSEEP